MNILFMTIGRMDSIESKSLYPDLLREFRKNGHNVYTVSPYERRSKKHTELIEENGAYMLHVSIGNITKCNIIEKGISTLQIEHKFILAIKKYFSNVKFDLILYSTPPITFVNVIKYIKQRDNAKAYLMLKDIFPQNAIDLEMLSKKGLRGILYKYFRNKEKALYNVSDRIGCMSPANVKYLLSNNTLEKEKVEVCPNSIDVQDYNLDLSMKITLRKKYSIPVEKKVFVYGGNLGKPQGIPFLMECLKSQSENENIFFLIIGDGTYYKILDEFVKSNKFKNVHLRKRIPKEEYDYMIASCDIGLIFLDHRFTIPNFPSRLLSYMQAGLPVLACTDKSSDIGPIISKGGFGWFCESNDVESFNKIIENILNEDLTSMRKKEKDFLINNYTVQKTYESIMKGLYL